MWNWLFETYATLPYHTTTNVYDELKFYWKNQFKLWLFIELFFLFFQTAAAEEENFGAEIVLFFPKP